MKKLPPTVPAPAAAPAIKDPIWRSPGFWIAAFFVLLISMNIAFFWIAGANPVEFKTK